MNDMMAEGGELAEFIKTLGDLEWVKFQARRPVIALKGGLVTEDRSSHPPFTTFRFKKDDPVVVRKLSEMIFSYRGKVQWIMSGHDRSPLPGVNWTVTPLIVEELREEANSLAVPLWRLCEQRVPDFGPEAYKDLLGLIEYIKASW